VLFEGFLLSKSSFESATSMKDLCITREQSLGLHDVVNDQGFAMHYRAISNSVSQLEVFRYERINAGRIDFFSYVECLRNKDLSIGFSRRTCVTK